MTKTIVDIAAPLGISVHDHIIVGKNGHGEHEGAEADLRFSAVPAALIARQNFRGGFPVTARRFATNRSLRDSTESVVCRRR
jgi:hypothetical protein